jgi:hypothetical protein
MPPAAVQHGPQLLAKKPFLKMPAARRSAGGDVISFTCIAAGPRYCEYAGE